MIVVPNPLIAGNWKMNMLRADAEQFLINLHEVLEPRADGNADAWLAPPATLLSLLSERARGMSCLRVGAQNSHWLDSGAHTGELSPLMLKEAGAEFVILGHSERRQFYGESSQGVSRRLRGVIDAGLQAIVCVGETREQYEAKESEVAVREQLLESLSSAGPSDIPSIIIAYEPVWAIGTGLSATPEYAQDMHTKIRAILSGSSLGSNGEKLSILYGGSASPANAQELLRQSEIDGFLLGGASLKADSFAQIINIARGLR